MRGMKRPQFRLRTLFFILTVVAFYFGIYFARQRREAIAFRNAATQAYLAEVAFLEKNLAFSPDGLAKSRQVIEDDWKNRYSWPLPECRPITRFIFFPRIAVDCVREPFLCGRETIAPRSPLCAVILWAKAFHSAVAEHLANPSFDGTRRRKSDEPLIFGRWGV